MIDFAFKFVDAVYLHVGTKNIRSQKAVLKMSGKFIAEFEKVISGTEKKSMFLYVIEKPVTLRYYFNESVCTVSRGNHTDKDFEDLVLLKPDLQEIQNGIDHTITAQRINDLNIKFKSEALEVLNDLKKILCK